MVRRLEDVFEECRLAASLHMDVSVHGHESTFIQLLFHTRNPESKVTGICRVFGFSSSGAGTL